MISERAKPYRAKRYGILNLRGDVWTPETFATVDAAEKYVENYRTKFGSTANFSVVPVRVTVSALKRPADA